MVTASETAPKIGNDIDPGARPPADWLGEPVPPSSYSDIVREKTCGQCGTPYTATFPQMFVARARERGGSSLWDDFRSDVGLCGGCEAIAEKDREMRERQQRAEEAKQQRAIEWEAFCPAAYRKTRAELLPGRTAEARKIVTGWQFNPKGLLIPGPSGTGKTRAAWMLLHRLRVEEGRSVRAFDCISFNHEANRLAMDNERCESWARKIVEADVLFFDDLGKFRLTDRVESELFAVIERRCAWERPIIATTNDNGDSLKARMSEDRGEPLIRRLKEFCEIVPFA